MDDKPQVDLVGQDGNAFSIIGHCAAAAKKAGKTKEEIDAIIEEMMSGDYDALLRTALKYFDVS